MKRSRANHHYDVIKKIADGRSCQKVQDDGRNWENVMWPDRLVTKNKKNK